MSQIGSSTNLQKGTRILIQDIWTVSVTDLNSTCFSLCIAKTALIIFGLLLLTTHSVLGSDNRKNCATTVQISSISILGKLDILWGNPYHDEAEIEPEWEIIKCLQFQRLRRRHCNKLITKLAQWTNLEAVSSTQKKRIWNSNKTFQEVGIQAVISL